MASSFVQFVEAARHGGTPVPDAADAHGFLSAAALCPGGFEHRPWRRALCRGPAVDERTADLARVCIAEIRGALEAGNFRPRIADAGDEGAWCAGFLRMAVLADDDWTAFHEDYPDAGKPLPLMQLFADPAAYGELCPGGPLHPEFVRGNGPLLGPMVRKMASYLLADEEGRVDLREDELLETWREDELRAHSDEALMNILLEYEDQVPRVAIDECIRRGPRLVPRLRAHLHEWRRRPSDLTDEQWWAVVHAVFILGAVPGREAAAGLIEVLGKDRDQPDDYLWDWIDDSWPALFRNKREYAATALAGIVDNRGEDPFKRYHALECVVEAACAAGSETLERALDRAAHLTADSAEQPWLRGLVGGLLLDFPRARHRVMLEAFARGPHGPAPWGCPFSIDEVDEALARGADDPPWRRHDDFLAFYNPAAVHARRRRWREEDEYPEDEYEPDAWFDNPGSGAEPYVKLCPKTGRNDPCPCGSGRKYKRCCGDAAAAGT